LLNRSSFEMQLKLAVEQSRHDPSRVSSLMCLDLDHFKIVNDSCGHAAGGRCLRPGPGSGRFLATENGTVCPRR